jgi:hydroxymethylbilane synthase
MNEVFRLGTRKSELARTQSTTILKRLQALGAPCRLVEIDSAGDKDRTTPLYEMELSGSPGFFVKELEAALLSGMVDLAVHSLKDLPTDQPAGLKIACVPEREIPTDCLISREPTLPPKARVGTSSLRREAQLLSAHPNLVVSPVRGNVPTRVRQVKEGKLDAVVLAEAGLHRLQLDLEGLYRLPLPFVAAPGQGALAVETRTDLPSKLAEALARLHDVKVAQAVRVERAVLKGLHGGCSLPLGVHVTVGKQLELKAFLGKLAPVSQGEKRRWISFHDFDIVGADEDILVAKTIAHFKEVLR